MPSSARLSAPIHAGSSSVGLILLDNAGAALRLQTIAKLHRFFARGERADLRAEEGALAADVLAADDRLAVAEQVRELRLHGAERGFRLVFRPLRRELHEMAGSLGRVAHRCR